MVPQGEGLNGATVSVKWASLWFQGTVVNVKKEDYGDHRGRFSFLVDYKGSTSWHYLHDMVEGNKGDPSVEWSLEATGTRSPLDKRAAVKAELNIHRPTNPPAHSLTQSLSLSHSNTHSLTHSIKVNGDRASRSEEKVDLH